MGLLAGVCWAVALVASNVASKSSIVDKTSLQFVSAASFGFVLVLGLVLSAPILWTIGLILVVVGAVLWIAGAAGHEVGGRRHYY